MKLLALFLILCLVMIACSSAEKNEKKKEYVDKKTVGILPTEDRSNLEKVAEFKGVQVTGVTVSKTGRVFANFPRWRENVPFSVVEVMPDGSYKPYPNKKWNTWNGKPEENKFTCIQAVLAHRNSLFVLDPSNPEMKGVISEPKLYEFDLSDNSLKRTWTFNQNAAPLNSYLNDLRVDDQNGKIYITDSGLGGIVVLDMASGSARRVLDEHPSTKSEDVVLTVEKKPFLMNGKPAEIHSDGIALSPKDKKLYYHALTGYHLYSVPTSKLAARGVSEEQLSKSVSNHGTTPAPDGMIFDEDGNLYMADLERNAVSYRTPSGQMKILIQDERIKWPDTFAIDDQDRLLFTDSLLQDTKMGKKVDHLTFNIYRVKLPQE